MDEKITHVILCTCKSDGVEVSTWDWEGFHEVWLSFWTLGPHGSCTCWRCRWNHIKRILTHGTPHPDQVCLDLEAAKLLGLSILRAAKRSSAAAEKGAQNANQ